MTAQPSRDVTTGALPLQSRKAEIPAASVNAETREFDIVISTGAKVRRHRWEGWDTRVAYDEELVISDAACNTSRVDANAVMMLDSHSSWGGVTMTFGRLTRAWVDGGRLMGRVKLHDAGVSEEADKLMGMIRGGTAPSVSAGYTIDEAEVTKPEKRDDVEQMRVTRWTLYEVSFVAMPADAGAGLRSAEMSFPVKINRAATPTTEEKTMEDKTIETTSPGVDTGETRAAADAAVKAERQRAAGISEIGARHGLPDVMVREAIDKGTPLDAFRAKALDHLASAQEKTPTVSATARASGDDPAVRAGAMADAMVARILKKDPGSDMVRSFMDYGFADMAADLLGDSRRMIAARRDQVLTRAFHTTSDFPGLLENVANKVLLARYRAATPTYRMIGMSKTFSDFKAHNMVRPGDFPNLLQVGEGGEIKSGTVSESKESMTLATYGRQIRFSRQMLINDDLNAMGDVLGSIGARVADFENATFWAKVVANPTLATDTLAVFQTATHGNLAGSGGDIDVTTLGAGRAAMRKQTSLDGIKLNIAPRYLVVSPDKETKAEQITTQITPAAAADVNRVGPSLTPVVDANLSGNAWYLFAAPSDAATFVYGHLEGAEGPMVRTDEPFGVLGMAMEVVLDFVAGAIDYRGAYKNPGA